MPVPRRRQDKKLGRDPYGPACYYVRGCNLPSVLHCSQKLTRWHEHYYPKRRTAAASLELLVTPIARPESPRLWEGEREAEALEGIGLYLFRTGAFQGNRILGKQVITIACGRGDRCTCCKKAEASSQSNLSREGAYKANQYLPSARYALNDVPPLAPAIEAATMGVLIPRVTVNHVQISYLR